VRILLVSPFMPYPPIAGGHAQVWAWLRRLAAKHEVSFVGFYERAGDADGLEELKRHCRQVRARLRCPTPHAYSSLAQAPFWVTEFSSSELTRDLREVAASFQPEVALFVSTHMAQYRRRLPGLAAAVAALEVGFVAYRRRIAMLRGFARFRARLDWLRMLRYETAVFRKADRIIAVSDEDARTIRAVAPRVRVTAVPPGVDADRLLPRERGPVPGTVLFVGHMEHLPNADALAFLYRDIWPRVRSAHPRARLLVAGGEALEELRRIAPDLPARMAADATVDVLGFVSDLPALMDRTAVTAAPIRLGGGVRNKVIEALASGLPVVTTRRGAEGLSVAHERELLIADGAEAFAGQLVRLLSDAELQARLASAGRELAAREHNNDRLARRVYHALAEAVGAHE